MKTSQKNSFLDWINQNPQIRTVDTTTLTVLEMGFYITRLYRRYVLDMNEAGLSPIEPDEMFKDVLGN